MVTAECKVLGVNSSSGKALEYKEIFGLSTESKPTDSIAMGSIFIEVDTGDIYLFNQTSGSWVAQFSLQE